MARREQGVRPRTLKDGRVKWDAFWSVDGKKYMKRGLATAKDAARVRRDALAAADRGEHVARSNETLGQWLRRWMATQPGDYSGKLERYVLKFDVANVPLQKLVHTDLDAHYRWLLDVKLGANSVRLVHTIIKKALKSAAKARKVARNVADECEQVPPHEVNEFEVLSPADVTRLLARASEDEPIWRLAVMTGMRRGELLQLRWADVHDGYVQVGGRVKTRASRRRVDLDPTTAATLKAWKKRQAEAMLAVGLGRPEFVCTLADGRPWAPKHVYLGWLRVKAEADLPDIRFHDLRHTHATHLLRERIPVHVVQRRLGHANPSITLGTYAHVLPGQQEDAAAKVSALYS